jgi:hypothetical protein
MTAARLDHSNERTLSLQANFFVLCCLSVPVVVMVRQLLHLTWIAHLFKVLVAVGFILFAPEAMRTLMSMQRRWLVFGLGIILYGLVLTVMTSMGQTLSLRAFAPHFIAYAGLVWFAASYDHALGTRVIEAFRRMRWWLIGFDAGALIFYRWNPTGADTYAGFESTAIMPTFVLALRERNLPMVLLHLVLFVAHSKRAITLAAFVIVLFWIAQWVWRLSWPKRLAIASVVGAILAIGAIGLRGIISQGGDSTRGLAIVYTLVEGDLTVDGSLEEKASEIVLAYRKMMNSRADALLGVGFGWFYEVRLEFSQSDEYEQRHYIHITPAFIHLCLGIPGLLLYAALFYRAARAAASVIPDYRFWGYFSLFSLIVGLSVLNIFTEPLVAFGLGAVLCADALRRGRRFIFVPNQRTLIHE